MSVAPCATTAMVGGASSAVPAGWDPDVAGRLVAQLEAVEHVVLPALLAPLGGHVPRAVVLDEAVLMGRYEQLVARYAELARVRTGCEEAESRCTAAVRSLLVDASLAVAGSATAPGVPITARVHTAAALGLVAELDPPPHLALAARLVASGTPAPLAVEAAVAATS